MAAGQKQGLMGFLFLRPTMGILLVVLAMFAGWLAWKGMVKESMPDLDIPIATIETEWAGADPETIDQEVTDKIEKELRDLAGLKKMRSASFSGFSVVTVEFEATIDTADAMTRLREKVDDAQTELPSDAEKPKITQSSVNDTPIVSIALYGQLDPGLIGRFAKRIEKRLERVKGVNEVDLSGQREEIIRIRLIHSRLQALGLSPSVVRDRIQQENRDQPWDRFDGETIGATLRLYGRFRDIEDLRRLPVMRLNSGRVVFLEEVAEVRRELERETNRAYLSWQGQDYQPSIDVSVKKIPGVDTIEVIERVKAVMQQEADKADWPAGLQYAVSADQSEAIINDLSSVFNNAWQAMLGVFIVLFLVLSWREALIAGLAIPITFLAALAVLWGLDNTLNKVVIVGLVLALGLLVDVFILMMEGMHENIFSRRKPFDDAALSTVKTYAAPAFAGQMTTILAMAPLMVIGGVAGKFISIIPEATIVTLVASFLIALLVTVPLSRFLLGKLAGGQAQPTLMDRLTKRFSVALKDWSRQNALQSRSKAIVWVAGAFVMLALAIQAASTLPSTMFPKDDGRNLGITVELPPDTRLQQAQQCADVLGDELRGKDYFQSVVKFSGAKSPMAMNSVAERLTPAKEYYLVGFSAYFVPLEQRDQYAYRYVDELRDTLQPLMSACPGGRLLFTPETGGSSNEDPIQIVIEGQDVNLLRALAQQVGQRLEGIDGTVDVRDTMGPARTDAKSLPRREALDFHKVSMADLAYQIRVAMTDDEIGKFPIGAGEDDLEIRMGTAWPSRGGDAGGPSTIAEAAALSVITQDGRSLPMFSLVDLQLGETPLVIGRDNGSRAVVIKAQVEGRTAGEVLQELTPWLDEQQKDWPQGVVYRVAGEAEDQSETFGDATTMMGVAMFLVFALLVVQFDSFRQPFIIIMSVPLGLIGVFLTFWVGQIPISFPAMVGIIALIGIVVNNAIVMIDTINGLRDEGLSRAEAAARGAAERLRPILATTITTVVGLIPLALSDPFWMPLCLAIISGLLVSTAISLLIVPCLYVLLTPETEAVSA